jgi:hypothetical protein
MLKTDEIQIGGDHYKGRSQHWDLVAACYEGRYLEGNISKYIARHAKKGGATDLEKAHHYTQKLIDSVRNYKCKPMEHPYIKIIMDFCDEHALPKEETEILILLGSWKTSNCLGEVKQRIWTLRQNRYPENPRPKPPDLREPTGLHRKDKDSVVLVFGSDSLFPGEEITTTLTPDEFIHGICLRALTS